jgi:hypothetical protein
MPESRPPAEIPCGLSHLTLTASSKKVNVPNRSPGSPSMVHHGHAMQTMASCFSSALLAESQPHLIGACDSVTRQRTQSMLLAGPVLSFFPPSLLSLQEPHKAGAPTLQKNHRTGMGVPTHPRSYGKSSWIWIQVLVSSGLRSGLCPPGVTTFLLHS